MPRAADEARVLAQRFDVAGLVWVTTEQNESSLWVYDASTDQVVSRGLATPPPFDAPTAASAALSVKTLLRSSTVAPLDERIGAPPTREAEAPAAPREVAADPGPSPALARLEMGAAARALAGSMDTRLSGGASVWFGAKRNVGVGLVGQFGPGLAVSADRFSGHFAEVSIAPSVRFRVPLARGVTLEPRLGTSLHATSIDGVAVRTSRSASDKRLDGSFDLGIALDFTLSRTLACGVDVSGAAMLRYQRYLVNAEPVFELRQFQGYAGLRLSAEVF
jgi:hypothetical protein